MIIQAVKYEDVGPAERGLLFNGCGPQPTRGRWWTWIPVPELAFEEACNRHDFDYLVGGVTDAEREVADKRFYEGMRFVADDQPWFWRWLYRRAAWLYYRAVYRFGHDHFVWRKAGEVVTLERLVDEELDRRFQGVERGCVACACLHPEQQGVT